MSKKVFGLILSFLMSIAVFAAIPLNVTYVHAAVDKDTYEDAKQQLEDNKDAYENAKQQVEDNKDAYENAKQQVEAIDEATLASMTSVSDQVDALKDTGMTEDQAINAVASAMVDQAIAQNEDVIIADATAAMQKQVEQAVTDQVQQKVEQAITNQTREDVARQIGAPSYAEATDKQKAEVDEQMASDVVQIQINDAVEQQMSSDSIKQQIADSVEQQMKSDDVKAKINQNVAQQKDQIRQSELPGAMQQVEKLYNNYETYQNNKALVDDYEAAQKLVDDYEDLQKQVADYEANQKQDTDKEDNQKESDTSPKTSDDHPIFLWVALMAAAFAGIMSILVIAGRKRKNR